MKIDLEFMKTGTQSQSEAWRSLGQTGILEVLADFDATLAGTIPLDVDVPGSDIDIICQAQDFQSLERILVREFSKLDSFQIKKQDVGGEPTLLATFQHSGSSYEVFAQNIPVNQQNAFLHMLIEAHLLKIGGARAKNAIRRLKRSGWKTEPAFASYFAIDGDPYIELRKMALKVVAETKPESTNWLNIEQHSSVDSTDRVFDSLSAPCREIMEGMQLFCRDILTELRDANLVKHAIEIDHACYRVATGERYEALKQLLNSCATLLAETLVNGRPIATYKLPKPIKIDEDFSVDTLELPAPKPGRSYQDGFEHIEVVLNESLENFMGRHPELHFDTGNQHAAINRDVAIKLNRGVVKFHELSLEQVIAQEQVALLRRVSLHIQKAF